MRGPCCWSWISLICFIYAYFTAFFLLINGRVLLCKIFTDQNEVVSDIPICRDAWGSRPQTRYFKVLLWTIWINIISLNTTLLVYKMQVIHDSYRFFISLCNAFHHVIVVAVGSSYHFVMHFIIVVVTVGSSFHFVTHFIMLLMLL